MAGEKVKSSSKSDTPQLEKSGSERSVSKRSSRSPKESRSKSPRDSKASSSSTRENLLLAGEMRTPVKGISTVGTSAPPSKAPKVSTPVQGTSSVVAPATSSDPRVDTLMASMEQQQALLQSLTAFMQQQQQSQQQPKPQPKQAEPKAMKRKPSVSPARELEEPGSDLPDSEQSEGEGGSEDEDEEEEFSLLNHFSQDKNSFVPSEFQLVIWGDALRHDAQKFGQEGWRKMNVSPIIKKWTSNPTAEAFTPPAPDKSLPKLFFQNQKEQEKALIKLQGPAGAIGAIATRLLGLFDGET